MNRALIPLMLIAVYLSAAVMLADSPSDGRTFQWEWSDGDEARAMLVAFSPKDVSGAEVQRTWSSENLFPTALCASGGAAWEIASEIKVKVPDDLGRASCALSFVQSYVIWRSDMSMHGVSDYWQLPDETLASRMGDCEDSAVLYCSILKSMGIESQLVRCKADGKGHMYAQVHIGDEWLKAETVSTLGHLPLGTINDAKYTDVTFSEVII